MKTEHNLSEYLKRRFMAAGVEISPVQTGILFLLKHINGLSMTEISTALGIDNSAVTGLVDRLEKSGHVARKSDPADRRKNIIIMTNTGLSELEKAKKIIDETNSLIQKGHSKENLRAMAGILNSLLEKIK
jgi:DNA-binding MarR family transcriptional regulator